MVTDFLPPQAEDLYEETSKQLAAQIQRQAILSPLAPQPILTSWVRQGSGGRPIVLLHGFDSSVLEFRRLLPLLAQQQTTWAVDLLGFGFTERRPNLPYSPAAILSHLRAFWEQMIAEPMILIGTSMGGATAIDFALAYPDAVQRLVLIDSVGYVSGVPPIARYLFWPLDYGAVSILRSQRVRARVSAQSYQDPQLASRDAALCGLLPTLMPNWYGSNITFIKSGGYRYLGDRIPHITQPTLVLWGDTDRILDPQFAHRFEKDLAQGTLVWIKDCGHVPHLEKPQLTARAIQQFLAPEP